MQIVELGDCSMVIMKDSEDPFYVSIGSIYREAQWCGKPICVRKDYQSKFEGWSGRASEAIYTGGRLVLFFKEPIPDSIHLHDKVALVI